MKEHEEGKKDLTEENKLIARRIFDILSRYDAANNNGAILDFYSPHPNETNISLCFVFEKAGEEVDEIFIKVPHGLTSPLYALKLETRNCRTERQVTSPYGNLPAAVIGSNNKLYQVENAYFFDSNGKAVKIEKILDLQDEGESLDDYLDLSEYTNEEKGQLKRLDIVPAEGERITKLSPGDYEQMFYYLDKIDSGEYKPRRATASLTLHQ